MANELDEMNAQYKRSLVYFSSSLNLLKLNIYSGYILAKASHRRT